MMILTVVKCVKVLNFCRKKLSIENFGFSCADIFYDFYGILKILHVYHIVQCTA